jgi:flavodoxin
MKTIVVYDSVFGNTKAIAETLAKEFGSDAKAIHVKDANVAELSKAELLIVGSPIIAWKPSEGMEAFLNSLSTGSLAGVKAATFDTRVKIFHGDAAGKIAKKLEECGASIITKPVFFTVKGKEGPLANGELEKASLWAKELRGL